MSATSFFRHFRTVTSLTPIQYQKQVRLQEARAKLLANPRDVGAVRTPSAMTVPPSSAAQTGGGSARRLGEIPRGRWAHQ
jgi:AraC-like DNA-binding protein